jgi:inosine-uridine nucleoside N-ribohydrolase
MALTFLLKRKEVNIKAITCVGTGVASQEVGAKNILNLLQYVNHPKIPVSYGEKRSLKPYIAFPEKWRKIADNVLGIKLPKNPNPPSSLSSVDLIIKILKESEKKITFLITGHLTNLATVLLKDPTLTTKIERVFVMGGNIYSGGPISLEKANYNFLVDSKAVEIVFNSDIAITLVPKETAHFAPINPNVLNNKKYAPITKECEFVMDLAKRFLKSEKGKNLYFWDVVPATILVQPKIATAYLHLPSKIMLDIHGHYEGIKIEDNYSKSKVCYKINAKLFFKTFFDTLNKK